jgi:PAS domain S-box-containing protein
MESKKILIVEDEKILLDLYSSVLTHRKHQNKYQVSKAANAQQALELAAENSFDLILTDYHLPGEDGINLIRKIKKLSDSTQFIIISGYLSPFIIQSAMEAGVYTCLKKPCSIKTIVAAIQNVLSVQEDDTIFKRQIEVVLENFVQKSLFITPEHRIIGVNSTLNDAFPESTGKKCFEVFYRQNTACAYCKLPEIIETKSSRTIVQQISRNGNGSSNGTHCFLYDEHIEPWRDSKGHILGFLISLLPARRVLSADKTKETQDSKTENKDFFIIAIDGKGEIVFADELFCAFLEVPHHEIKQKSIYDFFHSYFIEYLKKQELDFMEFVTQNIDRQVKLDFIKQQTRRRQTMHCEFFHTDKSAPGEWQLVMVCVNDEKINRLTKLIEFERESSKTLISGQFDMAITLDKEQRIQSISNNCLKKLKAKKSELMGRNIKELLPLEHDLVSFNRAVTQVMTLKDVYNLRLNISFNGTKISSLVNISGIRNSYNNEIGYVLILKDIDKELQMEATLSSIERMQALGKLAAGTAHQINNYTNTIAGSSELLGLLLHENLDKNSALLQEANEFLDLIRVSLSRLTGLTHHLTTFARAQQAPVISPGNINKIVQDALFLIQSSITKKTITLKTFFDESIPSVYFSPLHMEQAVINIIMNAVDAVDDKHGVIFIKTFMEKNRACISITDNGPGIPAEIKDKIFDAFVTTKPSGVGTGLGLNVTKGIIDSLKGSIEIDSPSGRGTTMVLKIPILRQEEIV